jgi:hypothetical protein
VPLPAQFERGPLPIMDDAIEARSRYG